MRIRLSSARGNFLETLQHLEKCLKTDTENLKARDLQAAVLRRMERKEQARNGLDETLRRDPLDFLALAEKCLLAPLRPGDAVRELLARLDGDVQTALDIAFDYAGAGLLQEALSWLQKAAEGTV